MPENSNCVQAGEDQREGLQRDIRKLLGVLDMLPILIVVMGSQFLLIKNLSNCATLNMWSCMSFTLQ